MRPSRVNEQVFAAHYLMCSGGKGRGEGVGMAHGTPKRTVAVSPECLHVLHDVKTFRSVERSVPSRKRSYDESRFHARCTSSGSEWKPNITSDHQYGIVLKHVRPQDLTLRRIASPSWAMKRPPVSTGGDSSDTNARI